jgi:hypothetical protein
LCEATEIKTLHTKEMFKKVLKKEQQQTPEISLRKKQNKKKNKTTYSSGAKCGRHFLHGLFPEFIHVRPCDKALRGV